MSTPTEINNFQSSLHYIVSETLYSYPYHFSNNNKNHHDDKATTIIYEYLQNQNLDENTLKTFKMCWSKTILAYESFGSTKRKDFQFNPYKFAVDVIHEMLKCENDLTRLYSLTSSLIGQIQALSNINNHVDISLEHGEFHPNEIFISKQVEFYVYQVNLYRSLQTLYSQSILKFIRIDNESIEYLNQLRTENSLRFKYNLQYYKVNFQQYSSKSLNNIHIPVTSYIPIHPQYHDIRDVIHGELLRKNPTTNSNIIIIDENMPFTSILGVSLDSANTGLNAPIWMTFQALMDIYVDHRYSIIPTPVFIQNTSKLHHSFDNKLFVFESPLNVIKLCDMVQVNSSKTSIARTFSSSLRKYPSILMTWSLQLSMFRIACDSLPYKLALQMSMNDTYLHLDDGRLLLGNLAFIEESQDEIAMNRNNSSKELYYDKYVFNLLTECLFLSRSYRVKFDHDHDHEKSSLIESGSENQSILTLYLIQGSQLRLLFPHEFSNYNVIIHYRDKTTEDVMQQSRGSITVTVVNTNDYMNTNHGISESPSQESQDDLVHVVVSRLSMTTCVLINGLHPGNSVIRFDKHSHDSLSSKSKTDTNQSNNQAVSYHLSILPHMTTNSMEVIELTAALEFAYSESNPQLLWTSSFFQRPLSESINFRGTASSVNHDWMEVLKAIREE